MRKSSSESSGKFLSVDDVKSLVRCKVICQFSRDVIGCKTRVKSVISNWSVSIQSIVSRTLNRSVCSLFIGFVYVVNKSFVRCQ